MLIESTSKYDFEFESSALFKSFNATLARKAMKIENPESKENRMCSMKSILEGDAITKLMFDLRANAFAVHEQFEIQLSNVYDIQVLYAYRFQPDSIPMTWAEKGKYYEDNDTYTDPTPPMLELIEVLDLFEKKTEIWSDSLYRTCEGSRSNITEHGERFLDCQDIVFSSSTVAAFHGMYHEWGTGMGRQFKIRDVYGGCMRSMEAMLEENILRISNGRAQDARRDVSNKGKSSLDVDLGERDFKLPRNDFTCPLCEPGTGIEVEDDIVSEDSWGYDPYRF